MVTSSLAELHILLDPTADPEWQQLLAALPEDLETSARKYGALQRKRQICSAADLLRLAFAYAGGLSLDTIAARAGELGIVDHLSVTGNNIAEHLADFPLEPGDLVLADRGYATREGVVAVHRRQADSLIRVNTHNLPLQRADGQPLDLLAALRTCAPGQQGEWAVCTTPTATLPAVPGRLVVYALSDEAAAHARQKVRQTARKKGRTPAAATLVLAGYVLLFTTVPPDRLTSREVLQVYRMRWQVEIAFKRQKNGLHIDDIRAKTDAVCYMVLLTRCLLLLLLEHLAWSTGLFSPSGDTAQTDESLSLGSRIVSDHLDDCAPAPRKRRCHENRVTALFPAVLLLARQYAMIRALNLRGSEKWD